MLPSPPDSDISTPSPPTTIRTRTWQKNVANEKKDKQMQKPKFQPFISRSKIDQILKSNDPTQSAREAWIRRKSYNPTAALKAKQSREKQQEDTLKTKQISRARSFIIGGECGTHHSRPLARQLSLSKLISNRQGRDNMYNSKQGRGEIMFSSLIEIKDKQYEDDEYDDKITELVRPFQYRMNLSEHSNLDNLIISTMANLTNKLSRALSSILHKAVTMLHQDQDGMVSTLISTLYSI